MIYPASWNCCETFTLWSTSYPIHGWVNFDVKEQKSITMFHFQSFSRKWKERHKNMKFFLWNENEQKKIMKITAGSVWEMKIATSASGKRSTELLLYIFYSVCLVTNEFSKNGTAIKRFMWISHLFNLNIYKKI